MTRVIAAALASLAGVLITVVSPARAQVPPLIDPTGQTPIDPDPNAGGDAPPPVFAPEDNGADGAASPDGFFYDDDYFETQDPRDIGGPIGPVPPFHVVRGGDTLWDICWFYFNNPWEWPKVWSYNPSITNPHWIYPGDLVRLFPGGLAPPVADPDAPPDAGDPDPDNLGVSPLPAQREDVRLRQLAFVDQTELDLTPRIIGSVEERSLLSTGDEVYLEVPQGGRVPKTGDRFTVYTERTKVTHPDTKKAVGSYVRILGELSIVSVEKGKRLRAKITDSVDAIERGAFVGPLKRDFRTVAPQRNEVDLQGTIVAMLGADQLIGVGQVVFIDKGLNDKVKVGNRLLVIRRGDAKPDVGGPGSGVGLNDRRFPDRALGEVRVVQAGKTSSVALVTLSLQEIGVGDIVLMRKSQ